MSILIAKHIKNKLSQNTRLADLVGDRMYPIAATSETRFPFIVYETESLTPEYTKDYHVGDTVQENIYVLSDKYTDAVTIAYQVRKAMEGEKEKYDEFKVTQCILKQTEEVFVDGTFVQKLVFTIQTTN